MQYFFTLLLLLYTPIYPHTNVLFSSYAIFLHTSAPAVHSNISTYIMYYYNYYCCYYIIIIILT